MGSLLGLGYGIYVLVADDAIDDNDGGISALLNNDGNNVNSRVPELIVIGVSGVVLIVSFLGCCGAIKV